MLCLLVVNDVYYIINSPWEFWISQHKQLLEWMAMRVVYSWYLWWINLINFSFYRLYKSWIFYWRINRNILLRFEWIIYINSNNSLSPLFKFRHFLARELIPIACNVDSPIIIDHKFSVFISPPINFKPLLFVSNRLIALDFLPL